MKYITIVPLLLIAEAIFTTLYFFFNRMFFIIVKTIIQQVPATCSKAFKYFVKFAKHVVTCFKLLLVHLLIELADFFINKAIKAFAKLNNVNETFVVITVYAIVTLFFLLYHFISARGEAIHTMGKQKRSKNKQKRLRIKNVKHQRKFSLSFLIVFSVIAYIFLKNLDTEFARLIADVI